MQTRRALLKSGFRLGIALGLGTGPALAQNDPAASRPREGDLLVKAGDATLKPLTPGDVADASAGGEPVAAWAMDPADKTVRNATRLNELTLLRFDPSRLAADTRARAAGGVVAYTGICTHTGCDAVDWFADEQLLSCPCHFSKFDPKDDGKVVDGPAPRMLPALPLKIVDGTLMVAAPFTSRVGFESL